MDDQIKEQFFKIYGNEMEDSSFNDIWVNGVLKDYESFKLFIQVFVLPSIITYEHQYSCSAIEFLLTPSLFVGYSGTLYNKKVLEKIFNGKLVINTEDGISTESTNHCGVVKCSYCIQRRCLSTNRAN